MNRQIITTADGSHTLRVNEWHETYHSIYGAVQESKHVYIEAGLKPLLQKSKSVSIFEMGFGTGLNAFLTMLESSKAAVKTYYETVEMYPLNESEYSVLNYAKTVSSAQEYLLQKIHKAAWNRAVDLNPNFTLAKYDNNLLDYQTSHTFDLVYFDAFAPDIQPELWSENVFEKIYSLMNPEAVLVTYCSKSIVRKSMQRVGLQVKKMPGPVGKREIVRAVKTTE